MAGRVEQWLKGIGRLWLKRAAPAATTMPSPLPTRELENISRILVVRLDDRLGNIVLLTALLVALKGRFSRAQITCLLARRYADLKEFIPSTDEFLIFDREALAHNPLRIRPLLHEIQSRKFDLVINASDDRSVSFNHLIVTALSGGRIRVGHAHPDAVPFYEVAVPLPAGDSDARHVVDMHLDLLRALTPIRSTAHPLLKTSTSGTGFGEQFRANSNAEGKLLVLIHPGGRGPKRWDPVNFANVAKGLHATGRYQIGLVWGPADADAAELILREAGDAIIPAGILPFPDLVSLISAATVFVAGDCGPMHLGPALGVATMAIFLVSDADKYKPLGSNDMTFNDQTNPVTVVDVVKAVGDMVVKAQELAQRRRDIINSHSNSNSAKEA